jgi:hypothetical protein
MNFKRLHIEAIADAIKHSQIASNPSFLLKGCQRLLQEVRDLLEFTQYVADFACFCDKLEDNKECSSCLAERVLSGNDKKPDKSSGRQEK